jgi:hypothetical protein
MDITENERSALIKKKLDWLAELGPVQELNSCPTGGHNLRVEAIQSIFEQLVTWFEPPKNAWCWFIVYLFSGFGNLIRCSSYKKV